MWDARTLRDWTMSGFTEHPDPAGRTLFRLETLDEYGVASDGSDYQRYLAGESAPDPERMEQWLTRLRTEHARELHRSRVHVLRTPLHPYLRFECEWAYAYNVRAGEHVGILDLSHVDVSDEHRAVLDGAGDFWLLRARDAPPDVVVMRYADDGRFMGAERAHDTSTYTAAAQLAQELATPFTAWWAEHPAEHRINWQE